VQPILRIELLGKFSLTYRGQPIRSISTLRMQSLLANLVLHPFPQSRQHLAFMFWPESSEAQARTNLRREYHHLRRSLPEADSFLLTEPGAIQWRPDSPYALDVRDFETAVALAERSDRAGDLQATRENLITAAHAYRGELLPGGYDDWLLAERERLNQLYARVLDRLARLFEGQHEWAQAIAWAERLLQHDPLREANYRNLMRLHSLNNDRSSALRVYHNCVSTYSASWLLSPSRPRWRSTGS
jgi:DNA-binding SARP family transcriptional activator